MSTTSFIRTIRLGAAVGLAALAAAGLTACASAQGAPAVPGERTLAFVATDEEGNTAVEDLGEKSPPQQVDIGDLIAFTQTLTANGKPAGEVHVVSVGVDHQRHLSEGTATIVLPDGTIALAGIVSTEPTFTLAVTGGTGAYTGDTGTMDFDGSGDVQKMTVHLRNPAGR